MQGYLAKDRLFNLKYGKTSTGTVAEIFSDDELERDIGTRLFKFRGNMKDELNHIMKMVLRLFYHLYQVSIDI